MAPNCAAELRGRIARRTPNARKTVIAGKPIDDSRLPKVFDAIATMQKVPKTRSICVVHGTMQPSIQQLYTPSDASHSSSGRCSGHTQRAGACSGV